jgi:NAD(P)-dependent dehydrogenase (short-subunit alcohol dehydrogenase family)
MSNANDRRVALIMRAGTYVGPALCTELARRGHDLVVQGADEAQVAALRELGARVEAVGGDEVPDRGPGSIDSAEGCVRFVDRALAAFGRLDAAALMPSNLTDLPFVRGTMMDAGIEDVRAMSGYVEATFYALRAVLPAMRKGGHGGQVVVFTSGQGLRPVAGWSLYGSARAGQNFFVQSVALEHAREGIAINAICSKNAIFTGFPAGVHGREEPDMGAVRDDSLPPGAWQSPIAEEVPIGRPGTMSELAWFSAALLDGRNRFQTAQCFGFAGGWEVG